MMRRSIAGMVTLFSTFAACAPVDDAPVESSGASEIVAGTPATDLPFACTISFSGRLCSGALIAPNVVLTAGHCVDTAGPWTVRCPNSRDPASVRGSTASFAPTYPNRDEPGRETIDSYAGSDLGLIRLDRPLAETRVATLDARTLVTGRSVYAVGRISDGTTTNALWRSAAFSLTLHDRRNGYFAGVDRTIIQSGDSGGPLLDAQTGALVGVNSAGVDARSCRRGSSCDVWAALAPASAWITATLQRYTAPSPAPTPPVDACAQARDCGRCTALPTCGWCDGRCQSGTRNGPVTGSCRTATWAWVTSQCR